MGKSNEVQFISYFLEINKNTHTIFHLEWRHGAAVLIETLDKIVLNEIIVEDFEFFGDEEALKVVDVGVEDEVHEFVGAGE